MIRKCKPEFRLNSYKNAEFLQSCYLSHKKIDSVVQAITSLIVAIFHHLPNQLRYPWSCLMFTML